jgi:hypothetical protein
MNTPIFPALTLWLLLAIFGLLAISYRTLMLVLPQPSPISTASTYAPIFENYMAATP